MFLFYWVVSLTKIYPGSINDG